METTKWKVTNPLGLHARPVVELAALAMGFPKTEITISCSKGTSSLKELMDVICLDIRKGDTISIAINGPDEKKAILKIKKYLELHL